MSGPGPHSTSHMCETDQAAVTKKEKWSEAGREWNSDHECRVIPFSGQIECP